MAAMYAVYHGPNGLKDIATRIHGLARLLSHSCEAVGLTQLNDEYFDTLRFELPEDRPIEAIRRAAEAARINLGT